MTQSSGSSASMADRWATVFERQGMPGLSVYKARATAVGSTTTSFRRRIIGSVHHGLAGGLHVRHHVLQERCSVG